jgi:hypothetical protein
MLINEFKTHDKEKHILTLSRNVLELAIGSASLILSSSFDHYYKQKSIF